MCVLCIQIAKEKMTIKEVARAYREHILFEDESHTKEVLKEIDEHYDLNEFADEMWELRRASRSIKST